MESIFEFDFVLPDLIINEKKRHAILIRMILENDSLPKEGYNTPATNDLIILMLMN